MLTIRPLAAALNKHRHRLSASPCRADGAKGAARRILVTPYPARKDIRASGPLAPLELPGEEMPGCLGARTLDYYHCNKEPVQPVSRRALRGDCLGPPTSLSPWRPVSRRGLALLGRTGSRAFHEDGSGVAVAGVAPRRRSLPAWCTACRAVLPRPPSRVPSSVGAGLRSAPPAAWHPRPSAPEGLPPCLRGRPDDRCAATGPPLRHFVLFFCPVPADFAALRLPVLGRCGRLRDRINPRTLRSAAFVWCSGPSADRRFALTALALRFIQPLARSRSDLASRGRPESPAFHEDGSSVVVAGVAPRRRSSPALCTASTSYSPVLVRQLTPFHLTTLLLDGPLRRPLRRYTAHAGGSATPVATAP